MNPYGIDVCIAEPCASSSSSYGYEVPPVTQIDKEPKNTLSICPSPSPPYSRIRRLSRQDALEGSLSSLNSINNPASPEKQHQVTKDNKDKEKEKGADFPCDHGSVPNVYAAFSPFQAIHTQAMKLRHRSHPSLFRGDSTDAKSVAPGSVDILHPFLADSFDDEAYSNELCSKGGDSLLSHQSSMDDSALGGCRDRPYPGVDDCLDDDGARQGRAPPSYLEAEGLPAVCMEDVNSNGTPQGSLGNIPEHDDMDWNDTDQLYPQNRSYDSDSNGAAYDRNVAPNNIQSTCDSSSESADAFEMRPVGGSEISDNNDKNGMAVNPSDHYTYPGSTVIPSSNSGANETMKRRPTLPQKSVSVHLDSFEDHDDFV